ncbi:NAD(P)/FAD-dependent oxidoreductase [Sulfidibacter corallicola]|uniref:NAD(P)/FAD-dependent oxidoreductase n=1 Tax=Sulfidibacter corallicola TaxID=2818388 RepID=A0A8A4TP68_SULCO|nr:nitrite reductase large subunit NirB [Sulfidibacter corallicola]QTD51227.1 NAD(P)/FAD-dependent oxidoreductase [Sulfidibacter corallicola]
MNETLVIIGNGPAAMRCLESLLEREPDRYRILVFSAEPHPAYNRILLSSVLAAEKAPEHIVTHDWDWFERNRIEFFPGTRIDFINREHGEIRCQDGRVFAYDRLVIATGSSPIMLDLPGSDLDGIYGFRDLDDVDALAREAESGEHAIVIGGGLLGLEAAAGLRLRGIDVTVVHLCDWLMEQQLDPRAGEMLQRVMEDRGIRFMLSARTCAYLEGVQPGRVGGIRLADGRELHADLVVVAVGIRPAAGLARAAGLECNRGILTNDAMQTSDPDIFAVGECVEHRGRSYGLVAPLFEMARTCAANLAVIGEVPELPAAYEGSLVSARLKVSGVDLFSAGIVQDGPEHEVITLVDENLGIYKKLLVKDGKLVGVLLYGDAFDASWYFQLLADETPIGPMRDKLIFGAAFVNGEGETHGAALSLPDEAEVCGCNGVCKGAIMGAIAAKGLQSLEEVRAHTKASASCGGCTPQVEELLALALGPAAPKQPSEKPVCACTEMGHDQVREEIAANEFASVEQAMAVLGWKNPEGCARCRPAINYYLLCRQPGRYRDDPASRFVNERVHANIQKDGTFSVIPRMFGGITSAKELRALADVVDKFAIPTVKVTGGQRIDLLGVRKEDLPLVWKDLNDAGMVSGHAYGKAVRTVKTCVGSEWCRFGVGDSTALGVRLERELWGSWTPHKVKLAVSGCPRNCAEATIKDIGVVAVESGWEIHVGGNGGTKVRATELLTKVKTADEVMDIVFAFLQLYREEARYGERTAGWLMRVGLEFAKERVVTDRVSRELLCERFRESQAVSRSDPWSSETGLPAQAPESFVPLETPEPLIV